MMFSFKFEAAGGLGVARQDAVVYGSTYAEAVAKVSNVLDRDPEHVRVVSVVEIPGDEMWDGPRR